MDLSLTSHLPTFDLFSFGLDQFHHATYYLSQVSGIPLPTPPSGAPDWPTVVTPTVTQAEIDACNDAVSNNAASSSGLACGIVRSRNAAKAWDVIWSAKIGAASPEFVAVLNISKYFAAPAIGLWCIDSIKSLSRNLTIDWAKAFSILVLVSVLYGNQAYVARGAILQTRALINYQNEQILLLANAGTNYENHLEEIKEYGLSDSLIKQYRTQCNGYSSNEEMLACLEQASELVEKRITLYENEHGTNTFSARLRATANNQIENPKSLLRQTLGVAGAAAGGAIAGGLPGAAAGATIAIVGKGVNAASGMIAQTVLALTNRLVQTLIEGSWLFTAIALPIPLSLAFYSGTRSVIVAWVIGFLSLGLFKLNLNLATSLMVSMIYTRGAEEPLFDLAILSFGSILLAGAMTAGGGMAIFSGLTAAISAATLGIVNLSIPRK